MEQLSHSDTISFCPFCFKNVTNFSKPRLEAKKLERFLTFLERLSGNPCQLLGSKITIIAKETGYLIRLCQACTYIVECFNGIYDQVKILEMHLLWKISSLTGVMKLAEKVQSRRRLYKSVCKNVLIANYSGGEQENQTDLWQLTTELRTHVFDLGSKISSKASPRVRLKKPANVPPPPVGPSPVLPPLPSPFPSHILTPSTLLALSPPLFPSPPVAPLTEPPNDVIDERPLTTPSLVLLSDDDSVISVAVADNRMEHYSTFDMLSYAAIAYLSSFPSCMKINDLCSIEPELFHVDVNPFECYEENEDTPHLISDSDVDMDFMGLSSPLSSLMPTLDLADQYYTVHNPLNGFDALPFAQLDTQDFYASIINGLYIDKLDTGRTSVKRKRPQKNIRVMYKCSMCPAIFNFQCKLTMHFKRVHADKPVGDLKNNILTEDGLTIHAFAHKTDAKFVCDVVTCQQKFLTEREFQVHSRLHGTFPCQFCPLTWAFAPTLAYHERGYHREQNEGDSPSHFYCSRCKFGTMQEDLFIEHFVEKHLELEMNKTRCPICSKIFRCQGASSLEYSMISHFVAFHDKSSVPPECVVHCDKCPAYFLKASQRLQHILSQHELGQDDGKKFECNFCGKLWKTKARLVRHEMIHSKLNNSNG